jgi:hypothetical protein
MTKKEKFQYIVLLCLIILLIIFSIWGCVNRAFRERDRELQLKARYASWFNFTITEEIIPWSVLQELHVNRSNPDVLNYTEIILVHSPESAGQFEEYVLVAWPQEDFYIGDVLHLGTQSQIYSLMNRIQVSNPSINIDFRDYGLPENEITIIDLVDNWEIVNEIVIKYAHP